MTALAQHSDPHLRRPAARRVPVAPATSRLLLALAASTLLLALVMLTSP